MKPLRFYEHFACAYGTFWIILFVIALYYGTWIETGFLLGIVGFSLIALIYAFIRKEIEKNKTIDNIYLRFYEHFASAFGTLFLIVLLLGIQTGYYGGVLLPAISLIYAFNKIGRENKPVKIMQVVIGLIALMMAVNFYFHGSFKYEEKPNIQEFASKIMPNSLTGEVLAETTACDEYRFIALRGKPIDIKNRLEADKIVSDFNNKLIKNIDTLLYSSNNAFLKYEDGSQGNYNSHPHYYRDEHFAKQWFYSNSMGIFPENEKEILLIEATYNRGNARGNAYLTLGQDTDTNLIIYEYPR